MFNQDISISHNLSHPWRPFFLHIFRFPSTIPSQVSSDETPAHITEFVNKSPLLLVTWHVHELYWGLYDHSHVCAEFTCILNCRLDPSAFIPSAYFCAIESVYQNTKSWFRYMLYMFYSNTPMHQIYAHRRKRPSALCQVSIISISTSDSGQTNQNP